MYLNLGLGKLSGFIQCVKGVNWALHRPLSIAGRTVQIKPEHTHEVRLLWILTVKFRYHLSNQSQSTEYKFVLGVDKVAHVVQGSRLNGTNAGFNIT